MRKVLALVIAVVASMSFSPPAHAGGAAITITEGRNSTQGTTSLTLNITGLAPNTSVMWSVYQRGGECDTDSMLAVVSR